MKIINIPYKISLDKNYLKEYFKKIIKQNNMRGMYYIKIYYDDNRTVIEIIKKDMDYYELEDEIDMNIIINKNSFLYEVDNIVPNIENIIYKDKIYIKENDINLVEFTKIKYKNTENIIEYGKRVKYLI